MSRLIPLMAMIRHYLTASSGDAILLETDDGVLLETGDAVLVE